MSTANVRVMRRKAAKRPDPRTVTVHGKGDFAEWEATARADFPASLLGDLQSGSIDRILTVMDAIVTDHNMPDSNDQIAAKMADVDPYTGMVEIATAIFDAIGKLPNR